ncbi:hypothetical protein GGS20DRAFT_550437 [Poronia punctata]|nr:hypothetical protein GGS20DRAFT_550437 [Poronia punctata]
MVPSLDYDAMALSLKKGIEFYKRNKFAKAYAIFNEVVNKCPCGVAIRTAPCLCKSIVFAIENDELEKALRKRCICSARSDIRCKNVLHTDALDSLTALYEAKGLVDNAMAVAEAMIHLSPRDPRGFLRLGKLLRVKGSHRLAYLTYQRGIELVSKRNPTHELLPVLRKVKAKTKLRALASDPLGALPPELVAMIFENLNFTTLCRCLRVSKSWKAFLTSSDRTIQSLWREQCFRPGIKPVRISALQKYAAYAGRQVTQLHIKSCRGFGLDQARLNWLSVAYKNLNSLSLQEVSCPGAFDTVLLEQLPPKPCFPQLTRLHFGFDTPYSAAFVNGIIKSSANTLQELTLVNLQPRREHSAVWPLLPQLRVLRLGSKGAGSANLAIVHMASFMYVAPNVEEVWVQGITADRSGANFYPNAWPRLKRLTIGPNVSWYQLLNVPNSPIRLSSDLEELYLCDALFVDVLLEWPFLGEDGQDNVFPTPTKLRKFMTPSRLRSTVRPPSFSGFMESWIRPGLESGSLTSLQMGEFPQAFPTWFKSESLTFLSLQELFWSLDPFVLDDYLAKLLAVFPNIETLDISHVPFSNAALGSAIAKGKIKSIYYNGNYAQRAEIVHWAAENHGVSFIREPACQNDIPSPC